MPASHAGHRQRRVWPRLAACGLAAACLAAGASGCAAFDRALGQRWAVINFRTGTPVPAMLAAMKACSRVPNARPGPLPAERREARLDFSVRYRIDGASDAQVALLQACLQRFGSVGFTEEDVSAGN